MSDAETRALRRAAAVILLASVARWGWSAFQPSPAVEGPDELPGLLEASRDRTRDAQARARPLAAGETLDPNRASATELDRLPGVGPSTASAIVANRESDGPFRSADDLARVKGVGKAAVARMRDRLDFSAPPPTGLRARKAPLPSVARPPPASTRAPGSRGARGAQVDVNHADAQALQGLPGIGPALAKRIIEARARGPFRSVEDLTRVPGIGPATVARLRNHVTVGR